MHCSRLSIGLANQNTPISPLNRAAISISITNSTSKAIQLSQTDTPQQKIINRQFSRSKDRLNSSSGQADQQTVHQSYSDTLPISSNQVQNKEINFPLMSNPSELNTYISAKNVNDNQQSKIDFTPSFTNNNNSNISPTLEYWSLNEKGYTSLKQNASGGKGSEQQEGDGVIKHEIHDTQDQGQLNEYNPPNLPFNSRSVKSPQELLSLNQQNLNLPLQSQNNKSYQQAFTQTGSSSSTSPFAKPPAITPIRKLQTQQIHILGQHHNNNKIIGSPRIKLLKDKNEIKIFKSIESSLSDIMQEQVVQVFPQNQAQDQNFARDINFQKNNFNQEEDYHDILPPDLLQEKAENDSTEKQAEDRGCLCIQEFDQLRGQLNSMNNNIQASLSIHSTLEKENQLLWQIVIQLQEQFQTSTKKNSNSQNEKENNCSEKYSQAIKALTNKNKQLKKQNAEMEQVLKQILLEKEIRKQRQDKTTEAQNSNSTRTEEESSRALKEQLGSLLEMSQSNRMETSQGSQQHLISLSLKQSYSEAKPQIPRLSLQDKLGIRVFTKTSESSQQEKFQDENAECINSCKVNNIDNRECNFWEQDIDFNQDVLK